MPSSRLVAHLPLSFTSLISSPMFPSMDSNEVVSVVVIEPPLPAYRGSRVGVGYIRLIHVDLLPPLVCKLHRRIESLMTQLNPTRCPIRQGLETGDSFPVG